MSNEKPASTLWCPPIMQVEEQKGERTGNTIIRYELHPVELDHMHRDSSFANEIWRRVEIRRNAKLGECLSDGRNYHVKVVRTEVLELDERYSYLVTPHSFGDLPMHLRPHIQCVITIALADFSEAKSGEHYIYDGKMHIR